MTKLRVFLAEDHAMVREGLKLLINAQPDMEVVAEAGDGETVLQQIGAAQPDIVIMDISMPKLNGVAAAMQIKRDYPHINVLALSMHEHSGYLQQLLQAGASGYILKRSAAEALITAIRTVVEGGVYLDPVMAGKIASHFAGSSAVVREIAVNELSEREADVLRLVAYGYSNKEVAAQLTLSIKTVETYKIRAMQKLGLDSRAAIVRYALQQGWLE